MFLQLVQVLELWPVVGKVLIGAERFEIGEDSIALQMAGFVHTHAGFSVRHLLHLLPYLSSRVAQIDAVAQALAHLLLAVGAGQTACRSVLGEHDFGFYQNGSIGLVETAYQFACHLQHGLLVFTGWYCGGFEQGDISSLAHGITEEAQGDVGLKIAHLDFGLHRGVTLYARYGDEVHQIGGQFGQFRNLALHEDGTLGRIQTCCEIVEGYLNEVLANLFRVVGIVGECLYVGHKHKHLVEVSLFLQLDTTAQ